MAAHSATDRGDKRERILDAAERIFARRGFYMARVSEIAREAGVADGTIYLYFKSKDDLLITLFESRMKRVVGELATAVKAEESARAKLLAFIRTHLGLVQQNPELAEILTVELRQSSKFMKEVPNPRFGEYLELCAEIIGRGQRDGEFSADVPSPVAARALFGAIDELALAWLLGGNEKFDIVRAAEWIGVLLLRGLERRST